MKLIHQNLNKDKLTKAQYYLSPINDLEVDIEGADGEFFVVAHPDCVCPELLADFEHGEHLLPGP